MRSILMSIVLVLSLVSCCEKKVNTLDRNAFYVNEKFTVESKSVATGNTSEALHVVIRSISHPQMCAIYTGISRSTLSWQQYYNYHLGDTLKFDYIRKDRFFSAPNTFDSTSILAFQRIETKLDSLNETLASLSRTSTVEDLRKDVKRLSDSICSRKNALVIVGVKK